MGGEHAHGGRHGPGVGLGLGDAGAGLDVGVQRESDGRENTMMATTIISSMSVKPFFSSSF